MTSLSCEYFIHESQIVLNYFLSFLQGATIPRCASGTKLLYLLPGVVNSEDAAITGKGSVGGGENQFPWLYEFEEQEGEIDFLTRILAITFYPASPGETAMTLGEVLFSFWGVGVQARVLVKDLAFLCNDSSIHRLKFLDFLFHGRSFYPRMNNGWKSWLLDQKKEMVALTVKTLS